VGMCDGVNQLKRSIYMTQISLLGIILTPILTLFQMNI